MRLADPTLLMSSSYLSTFMLDRTAPAAPSSEEDDHQNSASSCSDHSFPQHPVKRKRTSSNSSSECETVARRPIKQYSRRTSRNNSEKSNKSGTVYGSFGKEKPCYRPRFPSDDSDDFKSKSSSPAVVSPATSGSYGTYGTERAPYRPRFPSDSSEDQTPAPCPKEEFEQPDEQTSPFIDVPEPKIRPERSAAAKAQNKLKEYLPRRYMKNKPDGSADESQGSFEGLYEAGITQYKLDPELLRALPSNLQMGYKLYSQLRNDHYLRHDLVPFLDPVDANTEETKDYYKKISKPICLSQIEKKLQGLDYFSTQEIIADIRQMLENCYRFNGAETWISQIACKIEMSLEQQIGLLPYTIRGKCGLTETNPHLTMYRDICGRRTRTPRIHANTVGNKSPIMLAMEEMELYKQKEATHLKAQLTIRQKAKLAEDATAIASFVSINEDFKTICNSPKLISSCLMICVCQEFLELPFTVGALELGLLYPRYSPYLSNLMVRLCCGGKLIKEVKRDGKPASYEAWNKFLAQRVNYFYFIMNKFGRYTAEHKKGVTPEFLEVFGSYKNPLLYSDVENLADTIKYHPQNIRHFHELSLTERLTILHCLCISKTVMSTKCCNCFDEYDPGSLRRRTLGKDGFGNIYFDFPMWPEEIRVYVEISQTGRDTEDKKADYIGEVRCIARSLDDLEAIITQIKDNALPDVLKGVNEPEKKRRGQKKSFVTASFLQARLQDLYNFNIEHREHHSLVETTIYKQIAEKMIDLDNVEPDRPPPTPPRPSTPVEGVTSSQDSSQDDVTSQSEEEEEEDKQESVVTASVDVEMETTEPEIKPEKRVELGINSSEIPTVNNHTNGSCEDTPDGSQETVACNGHQTENVGLKDQTEVKFEELF